MALQFETSLKSLQTKFYFQIVSHENSFEHFTNEHRSHAPMKFVVRPLRKYSMQWGDGRYKTRQIFLENVP